MNDAVNMTFIVIKSSLFELFVLVLYRVQNWVQNYGPFSTLKRTMLKSPPVFALLKKVWKKSENAMNDIMQIQKPSSRRMKLELAVRHLWYKSSFLMQNSAF